MYCHSCYSSFDAGDHRPASVLTSGPSKEIQNICAQCQLKRTYSLAAGVSVPNNGPLVGSQRVPMSQKYPLYVITHYANDGSPMPTQ